VRCQRRKGQKVLLSLPVNNDSEQNVEDLLAQVAGRFFRAFCLLDRRDASDKVHLVGMPKGRAHVHGPADPKGKEDRDVDVRCEKVLRVPHEEDLVAVYEDEDRRPEDTPYSQTRL